MANVTVKKDPKVFSILWIAKITELGNIRLLSAKAGPVLGLFWRGGEGKGLLHRTCHPASLGTSFLGIPETHGH